MPWEGEGGFVKETDSVFCDYCNTVDHTQKYYVTCLVITNTCLTFYNHNTIQWCLFNSAVFLT
jgi:hypothetical protein